MIKKYSSIFVLISVFIVLFSLASCKLSFSTNNNHAETNNGHVETNNGQVESNNDQIETNNDQVETDNDQTETNNDQTETNNDNQGNNGNETKEDNYFIITFKDYDGSVLQTESIKEGETPTYNESEPTRDNDEDYSYTFNGWIPTLGIVTANTTYTATYLKTELPYTITIDLNGGSSLETKLQFKTDKVTKDILPFDLVMEDYLFKGYELNNVLVFDENGNTISDFIESSNMTFKAKWILYKDTEYKVEHYLQNLDDNNYPLTPYETETLIGKNDTLTNAVAKSYIGFTSHTIEQVNINSDGSTVIKLYYTRNSYRLTVINNDATAGSIKDVSGLYKYGQTIKFEGKANEHYTLIGWKKNGTYFTISKSFDYEMEASNIVFEAVFTIHKYEISLKNNASGVRVSGITIGQRYSYNEEITLTATNIPEGHVLCFERSDGEFYVGDSYVFHVPDEEITITVSFRPYTREDKKIYFGSYPQTLVHEDTNADLINELNTLSGDKTWTSYKYYIKDEVSDYMYYVDIDYDNNGTYDYRGVYFTKYRNHYISKGVNSSPDNSYQDDNGYVINTKYWFSYDPIEWDILSEKDGKALIIANLLLDSQEYYNNYTNEETQHNGQMGYSNNYELSNIRKWLNDNFYNSAFNSLEKSLIEKTTVDNSSSSTTSNENTYACNNTEDYMFLLSYEEATTYYHANKQRQTQGTDYAKCQGLLTNSPSLANMWWLRSPYNNSGWGVLRVDYFGTVEGHSAVNQTKTGIRPACYIIL